MLNEEVKKYRELSGDTNPNTSISRIGGYLDGYEKAFTTADLKKLKTGDLAENKIKKTEIGSNVIGKTLEGVN